MHLRKFTCWIQILSFKMIIALLLAVARLKPRVTSCIYILRTSCLIPGPLYFECANHHLSHWGNYKKLNVHISLLKFLKGVADNI